MPKPKKPVPKTLPSARVRAAVQRWRKAATDNPIVTSIVVVAGIVIPLATIVGAVIGVQNYFVLSSAYAADISGLRGDIQRQGVLMQNNAAVANRAIEINRLQSEINFLQARRDTLNDRVFELGVKRQTRGLSPPEAMVVQRAQGDRDEVQRELDAKRRLIDRLRTGN